MKKVPNDAYVDVMQVNVDVDVECEPCCGASLKFCNGEVCSCITSGDINTLRFILFTALNSI
jgi:hypothetical protein